MSQGNKKESKARLEALPTGSSSHVDQNIKADYLLKMADGERTGTTTEQNHIVQKQDSNQVKPPLESFDLIRDPHKSMLRLIDSMFDYLQAYAYEENKTNDDARLQMHCQRPILEKQGAKSWLNAAAELPGFSGKIYTYDWSLILKGNDELIKCYVIPSDRVISFNNEPEIYTPYLTINFFKKGSNYGWQIDGERITQAELEDLAKKMIEKLLKSIKNQQWNESIFCLQSIGKGSKQTKDSPAKKNLRETTHDPEQILTDLMKAARDAAPKPDEFKISTHVKAEATVSGNTDIIYTCQSFEETLKVLLGLVDKKLEQLVEIGGEALNKHDFKGAQTILDLTNQLTDFKNQASAVLTNLKEK